MAYISLTGFVLTFFLRNTMKNAIIKFIRDEKGATAIEYGVIAGLMAVVLVAIFGPTGTLHGALVATFTKIASILPQ